MELKFSIQSADKDLAINVATNIKKTIENYAVPEVSVKQTEQPLPKNAAGASLLDSILTIVVGQNLIGKLLDIIKIWLEINKAKRELKQTRIEVEFPTPEGNKTVVLKNVQDAESLLKTLKTLTSKEAVK